MPPTDAYPALLQERLTAAFSRAELADLCLRLGVNFDSLPDAGLAAQARELVLLLARQERLPALLALARAERPHVDWPPVPPGYRPPAAASAPAPSGGISIGSVTADNVIVGDHGQQTITHGPRYDLSGDFRGALLNIESTLRDTQQAIDALPVAGDAARAGLHHLIVRLDRALRATPPGRAAEAEEVAALAKELMVAAGAARPRRGVIQSLGDDLAATAVALADAVPDTPAIARQIAAAVAALVV